MNVQEARRFFRAVIALVLTVLITLIICLSMSGCTMYHAKVGDSEIGMIYFLSDKQFDSIEFVDPVSEKSIKLVGVKSEVAQIVAAAIAEVVK